MGSIVGISKTPLAQSMSNDARWVANELGYAIQHHGAVSGVTGSCHQLLYLDKQSQLNSILIDCGLFQGAETQPPLTSADGLLGTQIPFTLTGINALVVTHVHIDHVGRIPYLLAKGFDGPIYCTEASAKLLPLVLEDALKVGFTQNKKIIEQFLKKIDSMLMPLRYGKWHKIDDRLKIKLKPAGHILGSAYVMCRLVSEPVGARPVSESTVSVGTSLLRNGNEVKLVKKSLVGKVLKKLTPKKYQTILFSGDLGAPYSPILNAPKSPFGCDELVIESTYGDKNHENRRHRRQRLKAIIEKALQDKGTVIIPAFSIGRTQELLYELEELVHKEVLKSRSSIKNNRLVRPDFYMDVDSRAAQEQVAELRSTDRRRMDCNDLDWQNLEIIVDSPLASKFTRIYRSLSHLWDKEAKRKLIKKRDPLAFDNITTINNHAEHMATVSYLANNKRPAIVIAASGMCNGGRIMNYLKAMLGDKRHDVLFVGYQASGTLGRLIQKYGPKGGYVHLDGKKINIKAGIHTMGGYSTHAGQQDLLNFIKRIWHKPKRIRIVHGDSSAKASFKRVLSEKYPDMKVWIPQK